MNRKPPLVACMLLVLLPVMTWADDPARHLRDRVEIIFDPQDEAVAVAHFKDRLYRDNEMPGTPIVSVTAWADGLSEDGLSPLTKLPYLRSLKAFDLTSSQVRSLLQLPRRGPLVPDRAKVGDELKTHSPLPSLRILTLVASTLTDDDLQQLAVLPQLEQLELWSCGGITDEALKQLAGFKHLKSVVLEGAHITDAGLSELTGLKRLRYLNLRDCKGLTQKAVADLKTELPDCRIIGP